jgi:hypothetical protein
MFHKATLLTARQVTLLFLSLYFILWQITKIIMCITFYNSMSYISQVSSSMAYVCVYILYLCVFLQYI